VSEDTIGLTPSIVTPPLSVKTLDHFASRLIYVNVS
jgi:hypothetical protein